MLRNIAFPLYFYPPWIGGAEFYSAQLAERLVAKGYKIIVVTNTLEVLPTFEKKKGVIIHRFNPITMRRNPAYFFNVLPFVKKLNKIIRDENIEIIHAQAHIFSLFSAVISGKLTKRPIIYTAHGSDLLVHPRKILYRFLIKQLLPKAHLITGTSQKIVESARSICIDKEKIHYLPNAISFPKENLKKIDKTNSSDFCLAFVGRLHPIKGVRFLLRAFREFNRKYKNSTLLIVGIGPELPILKRMAQSFNLENNIEFLGFRKDVEAILRERADVLILPSLSESFPMVILTAFKSGCPVLGTKVGGVPEMIRNEETGLLVEAANASDLSDALERYYGDTALRKRISDNAFKFGKQNFSWEKILPKLMGLYETLY